MEYTFCELKKKTVINVTDGKKLGKISDLTICFPTGKITNYTVAPANLLFCDKIILLPCDIEKVGEDTVLVKHNPESKGCVEESDE